MRLPKLIFLTLCALTLPAFAHSIHHHRKARHHKYGYVAPSATVWVHLNTGIYDYPGYRPYGRGSHGVYMSEVRAIADGFTPAPNEQ